MNSNTGKEINDKNDLFEKPNDKILISNTGIEINDNNDLFGKSYNTIEVFKFGNSMENAEGIFDNFNDPILNTGSHELRPENNDDDTIDYTNGGFQDLESETHLRRTRNLKDSDSRLRVVRDDSMQEDPVVLSRNGLGLEEAYLGSRRKRRSARSTACTQTPVSKLQEGTLTLRIVPGNIIKSEVVNIKYII